MGLETAEAFRTSLCEPENVQAVMLAELDRLDGQIAELLSDLELPPSFGLLVTDVAADETEGAARKRQALERLALELIERGYLSRARDLLEKSPALPYERAPGHRRNGSERLVDLIISGEWEYIETKLGQPDWPATPSRSKEARKRPSRSAIAASKRLLLVMTTRTLVAAARKNIERGHFGAALINLAFLVGLSWETIAPLARQAAVYPYPYGTLAVAAKLQKDGVTRPAQLIAAIAPLAGVRMKDRLATDRLRKYLASEPAQKLIKWYREHPGAMEALERQMRNSPTARPSPPRVDSKDDPPNELVS